MYESLNKVKKGEGIENKIQNSVETSGVIILFIIYFFFFFMLIKDDEKSFLFHPKSSFRFQVI